MSIVNSQSSSFTEKDILFPNVPKAWIDPSKAIQAFKNILEERFKAEKQKYESKFNEVQQVIQSYQQKNMSLASQVEELKEKKSQLTSTIMQKNLYLKELNIKKKQLEEDTDVQVVSEQDLSEMLQRVMSKEKENEMHIEEMKKMRKVFVGQMCFYKEYLDVYIDMPEENHYILYYRRCQGKTKLRPKERIEIRTDNFKEFLFEDVSLSEGSDERSEIMELVENGVFLRQLIYRARKLCLGKSNV